MGRLLRSSRALVAVLAAACLAGCGGDQSAASRPFYPVKGKFTLPDGKPLAGVTVRFQGPYSALAHTESDGTFTIKGEKEGLPEGEYRVWLEGSGSKSAGKRAALPFASRYTDEDASGLTANVTPSGTNDFDFKLTKEDAGGPSTKGSGGPAKVKD
jgi:hypothetical protein